MKKKHLILAGLALLVCLLSAYFGVRIQNANANFLLTELNEVDQIYFADVNEVPAISRKAALLTAPFLLAILILQLIVIRSAAIRQIKNIAIGATIAVFLICIVDVMTLLYPVLMDFSQWGYVWICLGLFILVSNVLSIFIRKFSKPN